MTVTFYFNANFTDFTTYDPAYPTGWFYNLVQPVSVAPMLYAAQRVADEMCRKPRPRRRPGFWAPTTPALSTLSSRSSRGCLRRVSRPTPSKSPWDPLIFPLVRLQTTSVLNFVLEYLTDSKNNMFFEIYKPIESAHFDLTKKSSIH